MSSLSAILSSTRVSYSIGCLGRSQVGGGVIWVVTSLRKPQFFFLYPLKGSLKRGIIIPLFPFLVYTLSASSLNILPISSFKKKELIKNFCVSEVTIKPWLLCLSRLGVFPPSERSRVGFPFRTHAWVVGSGLRWGVCKRQPIDVSWLMFLDRCSSLLPSLPLSLKINE